MNEQLSIDGIREEGSTVYVAKIRLSVIRESTASKPITVNGPEDVASLDFIQTELVSSDREKFICLHLNIKHMLISYEVVSIGSLNYSVVHAREVFKGAMLANAAAVILAHNHPSDVCDPSPEDIAVTKKLVEAGNIIGISVLDHLIFGHQNFFSLKEHGLL